MSISHTIHYYFGAIVGAYIVIITSTLTGHLVSPWAPIVWLLVWTAIEVVGALIKKAIRNRKRATS